MPDCDIVQDFRKELAGYTSTPALIVDAVEDPMDLPAGPGRLNVPWMPTVHSALSRFAVTFLGEVRLLAADLPPSLFEGTATEQSAAVWFAMEQPHLSVVNGVPLPESALVVAAPGARCQAFWPAVAVPSQVAVAISLPSAETPTAWPIASSVFTVHRVDPSGLSRLRVAVRDVLRTAAHDPAALATDEARQAAGARLVGAASELLAEGKAVEIPPGMLAPRYLDVLDRIDRFVADRSDRPILLDEVAASLRLAPRTVHNIMKTMRGMTLQAYVKTCKLRSARRHLLQTEACDLVKQAALQYGYRHLGRFSQEYTKFFGESPSATLSRRGR